MSDGAFDMADVYQKLGHASSIISEPTININIFHTSHRSDVKTKLPFTHRNALNLIILVTKSVNNQL